MYIYINKHLSISLSLYIYIYICMCISPYIVMRYPLRQTWQSKSLEHQVAHQTPDLVI